MKSSENRSSHTFASTSFLNNMRIDILTVVPRLLDGPFADSIVRRGQDKGLVEIHVHNIRDWSTDKHQKVDDVPFGGNAGMVMTIQPILDAIESLKSERNYSDVIYLTPDGERLHQGMVNQLSIRGNLIMLCGHYKGVDQRVRDHLITREISIGDYVLSGGELAAAVLTDAIVRLIPGVIGDEQSALTDSFQDGILAPPVYTRPAEYNGWKVPEILRSGDHAAVQKWLESEAIERTQQRRPDLFSEDSV
jgi:tRNA (guanine37-N1)-methyltransferase